MTWLELPVLPLKEKKLVFFHPCVHKSIQHMFHITRYSSRPIRCNVLLLGCVENIDRILNYRPFIFTLLFKSFTVMVINWIYGRRMWLKIYQKADRKCTVVSPLSVCVCVWINEDNALNQWLWSAASSSVDPPLSPASTKMLFLCFSVYDGRKGSEMNEHTHIM